MTFNSRDEFISAQASEKMTLVHAHATTRLTVWFDEGGGLYSKDVPHFVTELNNGDTPLTLVSGLGSVTPGTFYYSPQLGKVYAHNTGSVDPATVEMVATYRFFFASRTLTNTWDLDPLSSKVLYSGRIVKSPEYKHKIGIDQNLISLVGKGALILNNNDGYFDDIFDTLYFENQTISVYSWNSDLPITDAKLIFEGKVTNKSFGSEKVTFTVRDSIFDLAQSVPQSVYDDNDDVSDSVKGQYKRWIYGRVDGLKLQSIDQISDGYTITGTGSTVVGVKELTRFESFTLNGTDVQDTHFLISTARDEENIMYWYGTSGGGTEPTPPAQYTETRKIIVTLGDSVTDVRDKTETALAFKFNIIPGADHFLVENKDFGESTDASNVDAGITITKLRDGISAELINGSGTLFLSETSPEDLITFGTQEFTVETVISDTQMLVSNAPAFQFAGQPIVLSPEIPTVAKNRDFFVADHECAELTKTLVGIVQLNRVTLDSVDGLIAGDFITFDTGERVEIKKFGNNNVVVLRHNLSTIPTISSDVVRPPLQLLYQGSAQIEPEDYTLTNTGELTVTIDTDAEFKLARPRALTETLTFTNSSRTITSGGGTNLTEVLGPRDWIRPALAANSTYYEILSVSEDEIVLRTEFSEDTVSANGTYKHPEYIGDDTIISANVLGRTEDGTSSGVWISTAAQAINDLLLSISIPSINTASFTQGALDNQQTISMPIPLVPGDSLTSVKSAIDDLSSTVLASITLDNDLNVKYNSLLAGFSEDIPTISDKELVDWNVKSVNGNIYRNSVINYNHKDVDRFSQEEGNNVVTYSSDFVKNYIGTDKTNEISVRLYNQRDAEIRAHREVFYNRLGKAQVEVTSDLRLEGYEIGDVVKLDIRRLYKRLGDNTTALKVVTIVGKEVNGTEVKLVMSDLGNLYNVAGIITPNTAPDYDVSTTDDRINFGYITDNNGVVDDDEKTNNTNLIS